MNPKIDPRSFLAMSLLVLTRGIPGYFCQNDQLYETCRQAFDCGGISGLGYPFWEGYRRPVSCGYPGFGLDCQDDLPLLNISSLSYRVLRIDQSSQRLRIARNDLWGTVCPTFLHQTTLDSTLFNLESFSNEQNITLYYGCTASQVQSLSNQSSYCRVNERCIASQVQNLSNQFSCNENGTNSSGFYLIQWPGLESGTGCGRTINVLVDQMAVEALSSASNNTTTSAFSLLQSALMRGFTVRWSTPGDSNCENCTRSGGVCGYNPTTTSFACYYADRPDDFTCRSSISTLSGNLLLLALGMLLPAPCSIILFSWFHNRKSKDSHGEHSNSRTGLFRRSHGEGKNNCNELPTYNFSSLVIATNNFSTTNKLGEGGFGPVYKGELLNGQFVAIKRLSRSSGQGLEEFKNEAELIAKLQHKNLVGILGCCIENDEKILVYEYMPNKSLDYFIFEPTKTTFLDWNRRVQIIEGIAQGILYLHQYSRLQIVHRDLKASNILLDAEMKPKISDFGMARIFGGNDLQANTNRIVGTYGYMSPEYAMEGLFSVKSDVFAFGVLMLEIISGRRNTGFRGSDCLSLLGYAWMLWENNIVLDLVDPTLGSLSPASSSSNVYRYIQIGLLCVQESANDRPVMSDVVAMLSNEQTTLASPKHPAFTVGRVSVNASPRQDIAGRCVQSMGLTGLTLRTFDLFKRIARLDSRKEFGPSFENFSWLLPQFPPCFLPPLSSRG